LVIYIKLLGFFLCRAKTIKNKARVNAELSPAELKALLKKAKSEAVTFQQYIAALEDEIGVWRKGGTVPKEKWVTMDKASSGAVSAPPPPNGVLPNPAVEAAKKEAAESRPSTPSPVLEKDEREEFLKRENELQDQIADKEAELEKKEILLKEMNEELSVLKETESTTTTENKNMNAQLTDLKLQLEKVTFENKDSTIMLDSLRESHQDSLNELEALKKQLVELKLSQKEGDKEQKKQEKMAQMLAELDPAGAISQKEKQIRDTLKRFDSLDTDGKATLTIEELAAIRRKLAESETTITQHEQTISELNYENEHLTRKRDEADIRLQTLELEYEELLGNVLMTRNFFS
jgi:kinesin family member 5